MGSFFNSAIAAVAMGIVCSSAYPTYVLAAYSDRQFVDVLWGLGYAVERGQTVADESVRQAIQQFQRDYQLPVTGTVGDLTNEKATIVMRNLRYSLNQVMKPNPPLSADVELYASRVEEVVRQFQRRYGLPSTGRADRRTRETLRDLVAGGKPPERPAQLYTTTEFRAALNGIGYPVPRTGALTDNQTTAAIGLFQRDYQLPVNFTADPATQEKLASIIRNLRNNLRIVVSRELAVNQLYDAPTEAAVTLFQRRNNLPVTGIADLPTRRSLNQAATAR
jgi:peptidoglycan hydrolase-like protein with peptidoglycan-binding domain